MKDNIEAVCEAIQAPIDSFDIRKLILKSAPPFEWSAMFDHPINKLGHYYFGIGDGFKFDPEKVKACDELTLWKLYGLIEHYWSVHEEEWLEKAMHPDTDNAEDHSADHITEYVDLKDFGEK